MFNWESIARAIAAIALTSSHTVPIGTGALTAAHADAGHPVHMTAGDVLGAAEQMLFTGSAEVTIGSTKITYTP